VLLLGTAYYACVQWAEIGRIVVVDLDTEMTTLLDFAYFSVVLYTTVGFGNIIPQGPISGLAGAEAVTGLTLITWSASFTFIEMQQFWGRDERTR
ncbi:MAG: ion channel, partial [Thiohalorhabdaceae bacterium]